MRSAQVYTGLFHTPHINILPFATKGCGRRRLQIPLKSAFLPMINCLLSTCSVEVAKNTVFKEELIKLVEAQELSQTYLLYINYV